MTYRAVAKCDICDRWMSREEVEACKSQYQLVCNFCQPFWVELEAMQLAADEEQAEREAASAEYTVLEIARLETRCQ